MTAIDQAAMEAGTQIEVVSRPGLLLIRALVAVVLLGIYLNDRRKHR